MADGLIDSRKDTDYITVSNNILSEHNKAFGIGWTENVTAKMTVSPESQNPRELILTININNVSTQINDNFFNSTNQRGPSADNLMYCHMFNNYYLNVTSYANYARGHTALLVEASYYEFVNDPVVAGPDASLKSNLLKFKGCTGDQTLSQNPEKVFNASEFYEYELKDPYDLPTTIPPFVGPRPELGVWGELEEWN